MVAASNPYALRDAAFEKAEGTGHIGGPWAETSSRREAFNAGWTARKAVDYAVACGLDAEEALDRLFANGNP